MLCVAAWENAMSLPTYIGEAWHGRLAWLHALAGMRLQTCAAHGPAAVARSLRRRRHSSFLSQASQKQKNSETGGRDGEKETGWLAARQAWGGHSAAFSSWLFLYEHGGGGKRQAQDWRQALLFCLSLSLEGKQCLYAALPSWALAYSPHRLQHCLSSSLSLGEKCLSLHYVTSLSKTNSLIMYMPICNSLTPKRKHRW